MVSITTTQPDDYRKESIVIGSEKQLTSDEDLTKLETMMPTLTFMSDWHDKPDDYIVPGKYMLRDFYLLLYLLCILNKGIGITIGCCNPT